MLRESASRRRDRAGVVLDALLKHFPDARIELRYAPDDAWQLLTAVMLSAQCTDAKVNAATPALFARFPDVRAMAQARPHQVEPVIRSLGLAPTKARNLVAAARTVVASHAGRVPGTREELEALPGIGRKSASVILANAFGVPALAVDTHVGRISRRLGLTTEKDPDKVESVLEALWPEERWLGAHHALIWLGRRICHSRKPLCEMCPVQVWCPQIGVPMLSARPDPGTRERTPGRR
ncbi:MAG: endonuclease III [Pseudomonadota bacterium]